jgi:hypothetical protein
VVREELAFQCMELKELWQICAPGFAIATVSSP